jgi:signal transduction histidine kinase
MLERANRLNGRLHVSSDAHGTTITLEVPARVAYAKRKPG